MTDQTRSTALTFKKQSLALDPPGHQGQTLEIVSYQPIAFGKAEID
jgi:hypothetical protein